MPVCEGEQLGFAVEVRMQVKAGDKVVYSKYAGTEVELDGEKFIVVKQNDILAILK